MNQDAPNIAVLGAGVVGLTVARIIQEELRTAAVSIIADKRNLDTTSAVAAGIFRPGTSFRGPTPEITKKWINDSWHYWFDMMKQPSAPDAGVIPITSYIFSKDNPHIMRNHLIEDLVPIYRPAKQEELKICGDGWNYGAFYSTLVVSTEKYLPWAEKDFIRKGGIIISQKIDSFAAVSGKFDLVFNCTGMGAKYLCNDHDLVPIRGQVIKVKAPWLKTAFYGDYDAYVVPGFDGIVTLGGTRQYDSYNLNVCRHDAAAIFERCVELVPGLAKSEILSHKVGLRPHRTPVRVEGEIWDGCKLVHCYGHGGYGVTCAPGTAKHAVEIGLEMLRTKNKL